MRDKAKPLKRVFVGELMRVPRFGKDFYDFIYILR
jgi:hypothetical protein